MLSATFVLRRYRVDITEGIPKQGESIIQPDN